MLRKRIQWLDFARGLAIFFVVCGHSLSSIYSTQFIDPSYFNVMMSILFTFMMPCFFAISGYLYKSPHDLHDYGLMFYKKFISLSIPYAIFSIVYVFMQNFGGSSVNHTHSLSSIFDIYSTPISYLWFLYALFFMFLITGVFDLLRINKYIQFLLCLGLMTVSILFPNLFWPGINNTFNNIIYFYFGYLMASSHCNASTLRFFKSRKVTVFLATLFIVLLIIQSFFIIGNPTNNSTFSDFLTKLVSILLLVQFSSTISHNKVFDYFDKYGKITLIIYLVHGPAMSVMRALSFKLIPINTISVIPLSLILIVIVWYISIFACYLAKKFTIINFIFYPRKQYISRLMVKTKWGRWLLEIR